MKKLAILFAVLTIILCIAACTPVQAPTTGDETIPSTSETTQLPSTEGTTALPEGTDSTVPEDKTEAPATTTQPEKEETKPVTPEEPKPTEPKPTEPKPTDPKPTDPKPTQPPHTHTYTSSSTDSTCAQEGKTVYTCECGHTYSEAISKKDHKYNLTETVDSTTSKKGYKLYTCSACGKSYKEELPLKKGAMETDMCGSSLFLKPLRHGGYYDFAAKIFEQINSRIDRDEAFKTGFLDLPDADSSKVVNWFTDTYRYAAHPFSYTLYRYEDKPSQWLIWGDPEDYAEMDAVSAECKRILAELGINSSVTQKEAITRINSYLVKNRFYEYDESKRDGSPYHSIFGKGGVCHNYAMAFQMLCLHAGIECHYYSSATMNHAWNQVYFSDGTYRWVDVCWNDTTENTTKYLLITTDQLLKDHSL